MQILETSTTLKMLTTLLPPTSGTAVVAGFDIVRQAANVRRVIGYVPQSPAAPTRGLWCKKKGSARSATEEVNRSLIDHDPYLPLESRERP